MSLEIKLPDLGDNISSGTVVSIFVSEGDTIEQEQGIIELETDKAVIEVPSPSAGKISKILISEGDDIAVGTPVLILEDEVAAAQEEAEPEKAKEPDKQEEVEQKKQKPVKVEPPTQTAGPSLVDFKVPNMGDNVASGTVTSIFVSVGDTISADQGIAELETDKAVIELPSDVSGVVKEILFSEGDTLEVGQKVLVIETQGTPSSPAKKEVEKPAAPAPEPIPTPDEKRTVAEQKPNPVPVKPSEASKTGIVPASPSVRRFAREIGINIHEVPGTGPGGAYFCRGC
jgi:pyruvate dehydrogenase E2 component (dihydrolipoamide acetyltransferase)